MIRRVHHIDFVVRDLDEATHRYRDLFGVEPKSRERLPERGVDLVRFPIGDLWVILVQPTRADSPVAEFLEEHGEGFFHIAYAVDDLSAEEERLDGVAVEAAPSGVRRGVEGWRLLDLEISNTCGVLTQLVEESRG